MVPDARQILIAGTTQDRHAWTEAVAALGKKGLFSVAAGLIDLAPDQQRDELRCALLDTLWKAGRMDLAIPQADSLHNQWLSRRWGALAAIRHLMRNGRIDQAILMADADAAAHDQQSYYVLAEESVKADRPDLVAQIVEQHPTVINDDMWPVIIDPGVIESLLRRDDYDGALRWCSKMSTPISGVVEIAIHAAKNSDLALATRLLNDIPNIASHMKMSDLDKIKGHICSVIELIKFRSSIKKNNIDDALDFLSNMSDASHRADGSAELGIFSLENDLDLSTYEKAIKYSDINSEDYMPMVLQCAKYVLSGGDADAMSSEISEILSRGENYTHFGNLDDCCTPLFKYEKFWEILSAATLKCTKKKSHETILQWFIEVAFSGAHFLMSSGQPSQAPLRAVDRVLDTAKSVDSRYKAYTMFGSLFTDGEPDQETVLRQLAELSNALPTKEWVATICRLAEFLDAQAHGVIPTWNRSEQREPDYHDL